MAHTYACSEYRHSGPAGDSKNLAHAHPGWRSTPAAARATAASSNQQTGVAFDKPVPSSTFFLKPNISTNGLGYVASIRWSLAELLHKGLHTVSEYDDVAAATWAIGDELLGARARSILHPKAVQERDALTFEVAIKDPVVIDYVKKKGAALEAADGTDITRPAPGSTSSSSGSALASRPFGDGPTSPPPTGSPGRSDPSGNPPPSEGSPPTRGTPGSPPPPPPPRTSTSPSDAQGRRPLYLAFLFALLALNSQVMMGILPEAERIVSGWSTGPKVVYGVMLALNLALLFTGAMATGYYVTKMLEGNYIQADLAIPFLDFCAKTGAIVSAPLLVLALLCRLAGRRGCIAAVPSAVGMICLMAAVWICGDKIVTCCARWRRGGVNHRSQSQPAGLEMV